MKMNYTKKIKLSQNVNLLYFVFLISIINVLWFVYYNQRCILFFVCISLVIYLINKNMIFVLGISLILVDSLYLLNLVKNEGFWEDISYNLDREGFNNKDTDLDSYDKNESSDLDKSNKSNKFDDMDVSQNKIDKKDKKKSIFDILKEIYENKENYQEKYDTEDDDQNEESNYMHDKSIIQKLKKLDPIILDTIQNMNSVHIKEINKTLNNLTNTNKLDP